MMGVPASDLAAGLGAHDADQRLTGRVGRLLSAFSGPRPRLRRLATGDREPTIAAVLREIDETILPRRLTVAAGDGRRLDLAVVSRRVVSVPGAPAGAEPDPEKVARQLDQLLSASAFIELSTSRLPADLGDPGTAGCSARALAMACGLDPAQVDPADAATALYPALARLAPACMMLDRDGTVLRRDGEPATVETLHDLAAARSDSLDDLVSDNLASARAPGCLLLGAGAGRMLFFARGARVFVLAVVPASRLHDLQTLWRDALS